VIDGPFADAAVAEWWRGQDGALVGRTAADDLLRTCSPLRRCAPISISAGARGLARERGHSGAAGVLRLAAGRSPPPARPAAPCGTAPSN